VQEVTLGMGWMKKSIDLDGQAAYIHTSHPRGQIALCDQAYPFSHSRINLGVELLLMPWRI
jgi:hypothetical protein